MIMMRATIASAIQGHTGADMEKYLLIAAAILLSWLFIYDYEPSAPCLYRINRVTHSVYVTCPASSGWSEVAGKE